MSHLNITVWPIDYMKSDLLTLPFSYMAWTDGPNRKIAQFALDVGTPYPRPKDKTEVLKVVKKYQYPVRPDFEELRRKNVGSIKQIDPQFAIKTVPHLDVPDFESFLEFTETYGALQISWYPLGGISEKIRKKMSIVETFIKNDRSLGQVIEYSEETVLLMLRDLKAMSKHIIALSNDEDETAPWIEAGYEIPKGIEGRETCREILRRRLDAGLKNFHLFSVFRLQEDKPLDSGDISNTLTPGIYSIICFQLYQFSNLNRPISQCAHEPCRMYFATPTGYGNVRSNRNDSKFCSKQCARNAAQKRYRNKQKVMKQK